MPVPTKGFHSVPLLSTPCEGAHLASAHPTWANLADPHRTFRVTPNRTVRGSIPHRCTPWPATPIRSLPHLGARRTLPRHAQHCLTLPNPTSPHEGACLSSPSPTRPLRTLPRLSHPGSMPNPSNRRPAHPGRANPNLLNRRIVTQDAGERPDVPATDVCVPDVAVFMVCPATDAGALEPTIS